MQEHPKTPPAKVPLFQAAATLAALCQRIEDGEELDEAVIAAFEESKGLVTESIDRRKALLREIDAKLEVAKAYKAEADYHIKRFEAIKRKVKEATREVIEANPDMPYRDSLGKKLSICKAAPSLKLTFDMRSAKSFSNVLDPDSVELLGIDRKYIKEITFYSLDVEAVKGDLLAGIELPWATLKTTTYLKGL